MVFKIEQFNCKSAPTLCLKKGPELAVECHNLPTSGVILWGAVFSYLPTERKTQDTV